MDRFPNVAPVVIQKLIYVFPLEFPSRPFCVLFHSPSSQPTKGRDGDFWNAGITDIPGKVQLKSRNILTGIRKGGGGGGELFKVGGIGIDAGALGKTRFSCGHHHQGHAGKKALGLPNTLANNLCFPLG